MNGGGGGGASGNGGNINNRWNADGGGGYNGGGGVGGGFDSSGSNEPHDEYEQLVHATRQTQSTSLHTTRRALEKLNNTELLARNNANQLQAQSEQLRRIDKKLDVTDHHVKASDAKADELKALKRFFFLPTFGASKRNAAKQEKLKREREDMERRDAEEEEARIQQQQQQQRRVSSFD